MGGISTYLLLQYSESCICTLKIESAFISMTVIIGGTIPGMRGGTISGGTSPSIDRLCIPSSMSSSFSNIALQGKNTTYGVINSVRILVHTTNIYSEIPVSLEGIRRRRRPRLSEKISLANFVSLKTIWQSDNEI